MNAPDRQQLQETYTDFSDEQILRLAADADSPTDDQSMLSTLNCGEEAWVCGNLSLSGRAISRGRGDQQK
jgi:hypothetical protein